MAVVWGVGLGVDAGVACDAMRRGRLDSRLESSRTRDLRIHDRGSVAHGPLRDPPPSTRLG